MSGRGAGGKTEVGVAEAVVKLVRHAVNGSSGLSSRTYRDLGKAIGVSPATLCRFVNGKLPDVITFLRVVDWLQRGGR